MSEVSLDVKSVLAGVALGSAAVCAAGAAGWLPSQAAAAPAASTDYGAACADDSRTAELKVRLPFG